MGGPAADFDRDAGCAQWTRCRPLGLTRGQTTATSNEQEIQDRHRLAGGETTRTDATEPTFLVAGARERDGSLIDDTIDQNSKNAATNLYKDLRRPTLLPPWPTKFENRHATPILVK